MTARMLLGGFTEVQLPDPPPPIPEPPVDPPPPVGSGTLMNATFDSAPSVNFGNATPMRNALLSQFGGTRVYDGNLGDLAIVQEGSGSGKYLRQQWRPNHEGSPRVQIPIRLSGQTHAPEMWLSYSLYFEPGWEWVSGGKLPGIGGGSLPSGGSLSKQGFSSRIMFRSNARLANYTYHFADDRSLNRPYGDDFYFQDPNDRERYWRAPIGRWFTIRQRIKMNTDANTKNGVLQIWTVDNGNDVLRVDKQNLRWWGPGSSPPSGSSWSGGLPYGASSLFFSCFYGGASSSWSPSKVTYTRFDNFKMGTSRADVD